MSFISKLRPGVKIPVSHTQETKKVTVADFRPAPRGDLVAATASPKDLQSLSPESPRPPEMLDGMHIVGADHLTAQDAALYELMVSVAYANDRDLKLETHVLQTFMARDFLGGTSRKQIEASMARLRRTMIGFDVTNDDGSRIWGEVPMIVSWMTAPSNDEDRDLIHFNLPSPIRHFMRQPSRYAYIELAALSQMKSKYGIRLYRYLILRSQSGLDNLMEFEMTAEEIAHIVDYRPASFHVGQFKLKVLGPALEDVKHSRRFELDMSEVRGRGRGRGRPVLRYRFKVTPAMTHFFQMQTLKVTPEQKALYKVKDHPKFQVSPKIWLQAEVAARKDGNERIFARDLINAWKRALDEALTHRSRADKLDRKYRGKKLLDAIDYEGADQAAYAFCQEEIRDPDLTKGMTHVRYMMTPEYKAAEARREQRSKEYNEVHPVIERDLTTSASDLTDEVGKHALKLQRRLLGDTKYNVEKEPLAKLVSEIKAVISKLDRDEFGGRITRALNKLNEQNAAKVSKLADAALDATVMFMSPDEIELAIEAIEQS